MINSQEEIISNSIFLFKDYRSFLKERLKFLRSYRTSISALSRRSGFRSTSYLQMLMKGERNLSIESSKLLAKALQLSPFEAEYFECLVRLSLTKTDVETHRIQNRMKVLREMSTAQDIPQSSIEKFSGWHFFVVLEALSTSWSKNSLKEMSQSLEIPEAEMKATLETLEKLNLITKDGNSWKRSTDIFRMSQKSSSKVIDKLQKQFISKALEFTDKPDLRNFKILTFPVSQRSYERLKDKFEKFLLEVSASYSERENADFILHINLQFLNLLNINNKKGESK